MFSRHCKMTIPNLCFINCIDKEKINDSKETKISRFLKIDLNSELLGHEFIF